MNRPTWNYLTAMEIVYQHTLISHYTTHCTAIFSVYYNMYPYVTAKDKPESCTYCP